MKIKSLVIFLTVLTSLCAGKLCGQNEVVPGSIKIDATFENISVNYAISDDVNKNSLLVLRFKEAGADNYRHGAITMRAFPGMEIDGASTSYNFHAGSCMFLDPETTYEIEF